jgi:hypothetical protein
MTQYETVRQQCFSFSEFGVSTPMSIKRKRTGEILGVSIEIKNKQYNFSDPNTDVIIKQLATLYKRIKKC